MTLRTSSQRAWSVKAGRAYLAYEGLQALKAAAEGENNVIISPSEGGVPLMRPIP